MAVTAEFRSPVRGRVLRRWTKLFRVPIEPVVLGPGVARCINRDSRIEARLLAGGCRARSFPIADLRQQRIRFHSLLVQPLVDGRRSRCGRGLAFKSLGVDLAHGG